jgi:hypothetical protein
MEDSTIILTIATTLLGGLNIFQVIFWRVEKRKMNADASALEADAKHKGIDLQQDQYDYLLEKLSTFQTEYFELLEKVQKGAKEHAELINTKCNEIAELKSKLTYYRGISCYKSDCSTRITRYSKKEVNQ